MLLKTNFYWKCCFVSPPINVPKASWSHECFHEAPKILHTKIDNKLPPKKIFFASILYKCCPPVEIFRFFFGPHGTKTGPFKKLPALLLTELKSIVVIESLGKAKKARGDKITTPKACSKLETFGCFETEMEKLELFV